ncbi:MAG: chorismate synthase [Eubacterium sp.]|nr:chorismate synthase [Eubacterium sp.]
MAGSSFGTIFKVTTWGESHGKAVGAVIDGCPAGLPLAEADIQKYLDRRRPGQSKYTTSRQESDAVEILSGVFDGKTTGTPISLTVYNKDQHSKDYSDIASCYRPGHADYTFDAKYGFRDYRGGGRSSGRETIGRVAAGAVAAKILMEFGITLTAYTRSVGPYTVPDSRLDLSAVTENALFMPDNQTAAEATEYLNTLMKEKNSSGGVIECIIKGMPAGIGDTVFEKLDANLSKAVFSIGAVKSFEIGDGFAVSRATGQTNNDSFFTDENGRITKASNHAGGILGGMSDGDPILLRAAVKPTPSIGAAQKTINKDRESIEIGIKGRHDPVIMPRAVVVVETMAALALTDALFLNASARMDTLKKIYGNSVKK